MAGTKVTADVITDGSITAAKLAPGVGGTIWQSTPKTSDFTAVSGEGYFIDTTSSAVTVTLPSSPSVGDSVSIVDQGGSASSNAIVLASANKIQNSTDNKEIVVSTGMTDSSFIDFLLKNINKQSKIYLLHCISSYPVNLLKINLNILKWNRNFSGMFYF